MKDRKGNELAVGDRVFVIPHDEEDDCSGAGYVRNFSDKNGGERARVDDGPADFGDELAAGNDDLWTWSAWVASNQVEKLV